MLTSEFDYDLPESLIAQEPAARRDAASMMVADRKRKTISHHTVEDLPALLAEGDLLVANDTKVIPARLQGCKETGGHIEILFIEEIRPGVWEVLLKAARRPRPGVEFELAGGAVKAKMLEEGEMGRAIIAVQSQTPIIDILHSAGSTPLPPYIKRGESDARKGLDKQRYQTIYAQRPGAVAAPTAGLHFTRALFSRLAGKGVVTTSITLHVGPGTFRPVCSRHLEDHVMDAERYEISRQAAETINNRRGRCIAVGTTSVRTLETVAAETGAINAGKGRSKLFIHPPYRFKAVDAMLTNFHLPRSTLLMMVCAFGGRELIMRAYREAIRHEYRFYSYGDCMLIL